jgi:hypothetical protein
LLGKPPQTPVSNLWIFGGNLPLFLTDIPFYCPTNAVNFPIGDVLVTKVTAKDIDIGKVQALR